MFHRFRDIAKNFRDRSKIAIFGYPYWGSLGRSPWNFP